ncbi:hypothetical protein, variant 1 [Fonticula alba]|uniref:Amine oxidase domain-containing protein n=1 Tax=Fonticula alba TaxID=691883 RepID=A0A058ZF37_FONAL|nr:hypothetical protein, variant 1 [Fonticula alba]KCV72995.1 hypothetical protein, variant 1 [Fonticula alba]|eukprot:XP_009492697.1 hypothetical protein, variant 1 [Fonticula alba]
MLLTPGLAAPLTAPTQARSDQAGPPGSPAPQHVAILGGGAAGVSTAYFLRTRYPEAVDSGRLHIHLLEPSPSLGGNIRSLATDIPCSGRTFGPQTLRLASPQSLLVLGLVDELGLAGHAMTTRQASLSSGMVLGGEPLLMSARGLNRRFADDLLGLNLGSLGTGLAAIARAALEPVIPGRGAAAAGQAPEDDETIDEFARRRLGRLMAAGPMSAMAHGVYAGDSRQLSMRSCFGQLVRIEQHHGRLLGAGLVPFSVSDRHTVHERLPGLVASLLDGGPGVGLREDFRSPVQAYLSRTPAALVDPVDLAAISLLGQFPLFTGAPLKGVPWTRKRSPFTGEDPTELALSVLRVGPKRVLSLRPDRANDRAPGPSDEAAIPPAVHGNQALVDRMAHILKGSPNVHIHLGTGPLSVDRPGPGGPKYRVSAGSAVSVPADHLVCAAPAGSLADTLAPALPGLAGALAAVGATNAKVTVVSLLARGREPFSRTDTLGYLWPAGEQEDSILGVVLNSDIFSEHTPSNVFQATVMLGGHMPPPEDPVASSLHRVRQLTGLDLADPRLELDLAQWTGAIPQYTRGHHHRLVDLAGRAAGERVHFVGSAFTGVAVPQVLTSAFMAARGIAAELGLHEGLLAGVDGQAGLGYHLRPWDTFAELAAVTP